MGAPVTRDYGLNYTDCNGIFHPFNPADAVPIDSYFPVGNQRLFANAQCAEMNPEAVCSVCPLEIFSEIFSRCIEKPKCIAQLSQVCKTFYLATKDKWLWQLVLKAQFPHINVIDCTFTAEDQVKIVFQRCFAELKQMQKTEQSINTQIEILTAPESVLEKAQKMHEHVDVFLKIIPEEVFPTYKGDDMDMPRYRERITDLFKVTQEIELSIKNLQAQLEELLSSVIKPVEGLHDQLESYNKACPFPEIQYRSHSLCTAAQNFKEALDVPGDLLTTLLEIVSEHKKELENKIESLANLSKVQMCFLCYSLERDQRSCMFTLSCHRQKALDLFAQKIMAPATSLQGTLQAFREGLKQTEDLKAKTWIKYDSHYFEGLIRAKEASLIKAVSIIANAFIWG